MKRKKINAFQIIGIIIGIITIKESISPTQISSLKSYTYDIIEDGAVVLNGNIDYSKVSKFRFITLRVKGMDYYYLTENDGSNYRDVFNNQVIYRKKDDNNYGDVFMVGDEEIEDYLLSLNLVKQSYSKNDLENVYNEIKNISEYRVYSEKVKVKKINEN